MKNTVTSAEAVNTIEAVGGKYPGFRRAHAKGIGFTGTFQPNGKASIYTIARHLKTEPSEAIIRFSDSSPNPHGILSPFSVKGMSVQMHSNEEIITNLVMATIPVFVSKTPEDFIRLMQVVEKGKMNVKERIQALVEKPEFHVLPSVLANFRTPKSYAQAQFYSIHAFILENELGVQQSVKFIWEPVKGEDSLSIFDLFRHERAYLEEEIVKRVESENDQVAFRLMMQLGKPEDDLNDSTHYWDNEHTQIEIGILTLKSQLDDDAEAVMFDPTVVPDGILLPNDPVLLFRSGAYHESHSRRTEERANLS